MRTTFIAKPTQVERKWYVIDAEGHTLGRLSSEIAKILRGKHKPIFTPNVDTGDHVIVINAEKIKVTGNKMNDKLYRRHTGHPGGLKTTTLREMMQTKPSQVIRLAVKGMLPKNVLGRACFRKLNVYAGSVHPHEAQKPEALKITY
ncbi:MAG: 50S ribosomal protein L13 [Defluviitaleaceae bacterium]|nr:50S ribosomal protein L13 [Defluviitaleaceae bacterium]